MSMATILNAAANAVSIGTSAVNMLGATSGGQMMSAGNSLVNSLASSVHDTTQDLMNEQKLINEQRKLNQADIKLQQSEVRLRQNERNLDITQQYVNQMGQAPNFTPNPSGAVKSLAMDQYKNMGTLF